MPARVQLPDKPLTTKQFAEFVDISHRTAEDWRLRGVGPRYIRICGNRVRYLPEDILAWMERNACGGEDAE